MVILALAILAVASERPNILWLSCEDMGPHLGFCGYSGVRTPHLDALAKKSTHFRKVWSHAPVCAPSRTGIILARHATMVGAEPMRSMVSLPAGVSMFPQELRRGGYYCTNNSKEDYNAEKPGTVWDVSSAKAHYRNRAPGQPFFAVFNDTITHESQIRNRHTLNRDPASVSLPPYWPNTPEVRRDWCQYLDRIEEMDAGVGRKLDELAREGLTDSTIIVFFSDHGSGMPRHKRWPGNSGLHVPMLVHVPAAFKTHVSSYLREPGVSDRLVGLVDLGPSMLRLAGIEPPDGWRGRDFISARADAPRTTLLGHRSRMDERLDLVRSVTDGRFVYIRNFHIHRPHGQHVSYMFETPTTRIWKAQFDAGKLNPVQARFWGPREPEELYDLATDPHETINRVNDPACSADANRMRAALRAEILGTRDLGFVPEGMLENLCKGQPPMAWGANDSNYPLEPLLNAALLAAQRDGSIEDIATMAEAKHPGMRYWAAMGALARGGPEARWRPMLDRLLTDDTVSVRVAAAEALGRLSPAQSARARNVLLASVSLREHGFGATVEALNALDGMGQATPAEMALLEKGLAGRDQVNQRIRDVPDRLMKSLAAKK